MLTVGKTDVLGSSLLELWAGKKKATLDLETEE